MTANDSDVSDGDTLTGSQVVRVYGENLTAPFVTLTFGGVEYTPLAQGEDYIEFILTNNGTAIIAVDGSRFMSFEVASIVTPTDLTGRVRAWLESNTSVDDLDSARETYSGCLNYPLVTTAEYPRMRCDLYFQSPPSVEESDFNVVGGELLSLVVLQDRSIAVLRFLPTTPSTVVYIIYNDFIFFVGNYTTE